MNDEALAGDLEYIASRTFGIVGDKERAATFTTAAARLRALNAENAKLLSALDKLVSDHFTHPDHVPEEFRTLLE